MNDERPPSPFRWITTLSILFLIPLFAVAIWQAGEQVKQSPDFCVSCHLQSGQPLHGEKERAMKGTPPRTLAGAHHQATTGERPGCYRCHRGSGRGERVVTAWYELKNTVTYLVGAFEEPKRLSRPFRDESCLDCHRALRRDAARGGYHAFAAHDGIARIACADCHPIHTSAEGEGLYRRAVIEGKCAACHQRPDQTLYVIRALGVKAFPPVPVATE
ncbi:MAG: NapC/NirT family cytochrome c [Nitrospinae bacterium]|nr:NapC/NirT family cytochrome c [Nitrospinota bacterium]